MCKQTKPTDAFSVKASTKTGFDYYCKACRCAATRRWQMKQPQEEFRARARDRYKLRAYGVTPADIAGMTEEQNGRCAICGSEGPLVIDHCHATGSVRALLCSNCNCGLGQFQDSIFRLESAIAYLHEHSTVAA